MPTKADLHALIDALPADLAQAEEQALRVRRAIAAAGRRASQRATRPLWSRTTPPLVWMVVGGALVVAGVALGWCRHERVGSSKPPDAVPDHAPMMASVPEVLPEVVREPAVDAPEPPADAQPRARRRRGTPGTPGTAERGDAE